MSTWPPELSEQQLQDLTRRASAYALSHALLYLPPGTPQQELIPTSAIHAPISLFPSLFPRTLFQRALRLQSIYNVLYARISLDEEFLDNVMGAVDGVGAVDEFVGNLWRGWKQLREEGGLVQLGLFRSDYMIHAPPDSDSDSPSLKQVEFNTIACSFVTLSERTAAMHRYLCASTDGFYSSPPFSMEDFPPNETASKLADGLAEAHKAYNNPKAWILFVVLPGERNVFDQRGLEYELWERHAIHVIRRTFDDLATSATLHPTTHALSLDPFPPSSSRIEISTVYFRVGFVPTDFPTPTHYVTRILLERSRAIKCPSIALQLAGGKKVQQVLTRPGMLERFLCDERRWGRGRVFGAEEVEEVRGSWVGMWGLDEQRYDEGGVGSGVDRARSGAMNLVLKPQREGGGNNVYKGAIPAFLDALPASERRAWIAMELIRPPRNTENYLLRASPEGAVKTKVVNELGVFGWALFGAEGEVTEGGAGWLVRTKNEGSDEGGVVAGFSVLDSVVLVDV